MTSSISRIALADLLKQIKLHGNILGLCSHKYRKKGTHGYGQKIEQQTG